MIRTQLGNVPTSSPGAEPLRVAIRGRAQSPTHGRIGGIARNREVGAKVRDLLKEKGVPARQFIRYNAFALHVERYCRNSHDLHLNLAVSYIVAEFHCKGLAREIPVDIARVVFNIPDLS